MHFWPEYHTSDAVFFLVHHIRGTWCQYSYITLIAWLRWCLLYFYNVFYHFSPSVHDKYFGEILWGYVSVLFLFILCPLILHPSWEHAYNNCHCDVVLLMILCSPHSFYFYWLKSFCKWKLSLFPGLLIYSIIWMFIV